MQRHFPDNGETDRYPAFSVTRKPGGVVRVFLTNGHGDGIKVYITESQLSEFRRAIEMFTEDVREVEVSQFTGNKAQASPA